MHAALEIMGGAGQERAEHKQEEADNSDVQGEKRPVRLASRHAAGENARLMSAQALGTMAGNKTGRMMSSGNRNPSGA